MKIQKGQTLKNGLGQNVLIVNATEASNSDSFPIKGYIEGGCSIEDYTEEGYYFLNEKSPEQDLIIPEGIMIGGVYQCQDPEFSVKIVALSESGKFIGEIYCNTNGRPFATDYFSQKGKSEEEYYDLTLEKKEPAEIPLGPADFPPGTVVQRENMKEEEYLLVEKVLSDGIIYSGLVWLLSYKILMNNKMRYKKPGQTAWNPCSKKA